MSHTLKSIFQIVLALTVLVAILLGLSKFGRETKFQASSENILYYGDTCPHCKDLEEILVANGVYGKISIERKEVYNNQENANDLAAAAASCNITDSNIGVPFLYSQGQCFIGNDQIEPYLLEKAGVTSK